MSQSTRVAQIAKVNPVHQRLADWLIAFGGTKKGWGRAAAEHFGYSQPWISTIYHSDAFQDYYQQLSLTHSEALAIGLADKVNGVAGMALDEIGRRLENPEALPLNQVLEIADMTLKRAGFERGAVPAQQNNTFIVSQAELAEARAQMRGGQAKVIELKAEAPVEGEKP